MISDTILIDSSGGYIYVFLTINSLRISFCIVPVSLFCLTPCSSAATIKLASTGITAPFIVIDTDISSSGILSKRVFISSTLSIATPAFPTSPTTSGWSESYPLCVARSNATESPFCPFSSAFL